MKALADASLLVWVQHSECGGSQVNSSLQQSCVRDTMMSLIVQKSKQIWRGNSPEVIQRSENKLDWNSNAVTL